MRTASASASRAFALMGAFLAVSVLSGLLLAGLALPGAWATGSATRDGVDFFNSLPDELAEPPLSEQSTVLDAQGRPLAHFYDEQRILVPLSRIAPVMRQAIVAIEDSRFYDHGGVDPKGLLRAFVNNQVNDGKTEGASTLTQQYIKLRILEAAVTSGDAAAQTAALSQNYTRKLQEVRMAVSLEKKKSKDEILADYLNIANFGDSTYGIEAASQYFFNGTSAANLTLPQAALLAGLVQSPSRYDPFQHANAAKNRRTSVLTRMHELGDIDDAQFTAAMQAPLGVERKPATSGCLTAREDAYFCDYLRNEITTDPAFKSLGTTATARSDALKRDGLTIRTTLNGTIQTAAQQAILAKVPIGDPSGVGAAAVTVEPATGKVLAMVQDREYYPGTKPGQTEINYNVDQDVGSGNGFQTGSTFKAFTLATWLAKGKGLYDVVDADKRARNPSEFTSCSGPLSGPAWNPSNSEGTEGGPMTVLDATRNSVNTAFVDMATRLSLCDIAATATKMGVHKASAYNSGCEAKATTQLPDCTPSMVLGSLLISPMTMAAAYATFAANGTYCRPIVVSSITDRDGKPLAVPGSSCSQVLDPNVAHGVTYALKTVLQNGTAAGEGIGRPAAGKTGTTDNSVDTWFIGYTPQRTTAVWVGDNPNPDRAGRASLSDRRIGGHSYGSVFGATIAAPIWHDIMTTASQGLPALDWPDPTGKILQGSSVSVPDVTGQPIDQALATLDAAGFNASVGPQVPSDITPDLVAETSPAAGSRVSPQSSIIIHPGDGQGTGQGNGQGGGQGNGQGNGLALATPIGSPATGVGTTAPLPAKAPRSPKPSKSPTR
jgi:membrane peptidoglycan carboxypeptidase